MKKMRLILAGALVLAVGLTACGPSQREENAVKYKIESGEKLSNDDYTVMIKYVGEYAQKAQPYLDNIINGTDVETSQQELKELDDEYPLVDVYRKCIQRTPAVCFDDDNLALLQQYGGYLEFTMPAQVGYQTLKDEAGVELQTPDAGVDNGVVAGAVDELKVKD